MHLFHQLQEEDQHNAIHYCMHMVIEGMLEEGLQIDPLSEEDKKMCSMIDSLLVEAKKLPEDEQFQFISGNTDTEHFIFDLSLNMARGAYYHSDDDLVIHYESLRDHQHHSEDGEINEDVNTADDLVNYIQKPNQNLN